MTAEVFKIRVLGRLKRSTREIFKDVLEIDRKRENEEVLFVDFSMYDIPIGYSFCKIESSDGNILYSQEIVLKKVSQQFKLLYDEIPHGHKTVCKFEFVEGFVPEVINNLPQINDWFDYKIYLIFS